MPLLCAVWFVKMCSSLSLQRCMRGNLVATDKDLNILLIASWSTLDVF